jgi:thiosulfate dehydrogenase [quinone] large subunit
MRAGFEFKDERLGYALLRVVLGVNLSMHGVGRMLTGWGEFGFKLQTQFAHSLLPASAVWAFGELLPGIECLLGALILVGLRTRAALIAAGTLMAVLTFGSGLIQDFAAAGTQLMYAAIIAALVALVRFDGWSVDAWMRLSDQGPRVDGGVDVPSGDGG